MPPLKHFWGGSCPPCPPSAAAPARLSLLKTTEGNTASIPAVRIGTAVQPTASFDQQLLLTNISKTMNSHAGEPVYEAIPTGETTEESEYDYPKFSSDDPDYICI